MSEKYHNNIIIYYNPKQSKWITEEEYSKIIRKNPLDKRLKDIIPITKESAYYIFFKDKIEELTNEQIQMQLN